MSYFERPNVNGGTTSFLTFGKNNSERPATITQKSGGTTEVTIRTVDVEKPLSKQPSVFHKEGTYEYRNGEVSLIKKQSFSPAKDIESIHDGIIGTARDNLGVPINDMSKIKDDTRITINGVQTTVAQAAKLGLLKKTITNNNEVTFQDVEGSNQNVNTNDLSEAVVDGSDSINFNGSSQVLLNDISNEHGSDFTDAIVMKAITGIEHDDLTSSAGELASKLGIEPEQAAEMIHGVVTEIESNVSKYIDNNFDVDGVKAVEWCSENLDKTVKLDLQRRIYFGDITAVHDLVRHYKAKK